MALTADHVAGGTGHIADHNLIDTKLGSVMFVNEMPPNVKHLGAAGNGSTDDTAAINAAFSANYGSLFFPPGYYQYNGTGMAFANINVIGSGSSQTIINLGTNSYMFSCTEAQNELYIQGLATEGGKGLYRNVSTAFNVRNAKFTIRDFRVNNYTGTAIGHDAPDFPNWFIQNGHLHAASRTGIGIALNGLTDNSLIDSIAFGYYRTGIKLGYAGNNAKIRNCDLTYGSATSPGQASSGVLVTHIHIVPRPQFDGSGYGLVITENKFGNEWAPSGSMANDKVIVYADDDTSAGTGFLDRYPKTGTASAGYIGGHYVYGNGTYGGGSGQHALVYSTTPNVTGCNYGPNFVYGTYPSYVLEFLSSLTPTRSANNGWNLGSMMFPNTQQMSGFTPCNKNGDGTAGYGGKMLTYQDPLGMIGY